VTAKGGVDWTAVRRRLAEGQESLADLMEVGGERFQALLRERARALAEPGKAALRPAATVQALVIRAGAERYGLELDKLAGILPFASCALVAGGPSELIGLVNARGEIWAAFEFRRLMGAGAAEAPSGGYVVLLRHGRRRVGLRVDEAERVRALTHADLKSSPEKTSGIAAEFIKGVTPDSVILVDLDALWTHPAIAEET
jgi:chemotaxis signal transduction protein